MIALVAVACGDAAATAPPGADSAGVLIRESPSPFRQVSAGPVSALIPDEWHPRLAGALDDPRQGIVAGPRPAAWRADRPPLEGLAAMWIDGTEVGVPSDYYYLAATGPGARGADGVRSSAARPASTSSPTTCPRSRRRARFARRLRRPRPRDLHGRPTADAVGLLRGGARVRAGARGRHPELGSVPRGRGHAGVAAGLVPAQPAARRTEFNGSSVADMIDAATPVPAPVEL